MAYETSSKLVSHVAHSGGTPADVEKMLRQRTVSFYVPPDFTSLPLGTAVANQAADAAALATEYVLMSTGVARGQLPIHVLNVDVIPNADITENNTDYITVVCGYGDLANGALTTIATADTTVTGAVTWAALTKINLYNSTSGGTAVAANKRISWKMTKGGSGKAWPGGTVEITFTID